MAQTVDLRPYQYEAIEKARGAIKSGSSRFIMCSPTGSGKTFMFSFLVKMATQKGKRVLIITHRSELLTQTDGSLSRLGVSPSLIEPSGEGISPDKLVHVAMVETLSRRITKEEYIDFIQSQDLVIIDECHIGNFDKLFEKFPQKTVVIGFTASPFRYGNQKPLGQFYSQIQDVITIPELVRTGYLSKPKSYGVKIDLKGVEKKGYDYDSEQLAKRYSDNKVWRGVIENYNRICPKSKAIAFCPNIKSSIQLCQELCNAGINAKYLHGDADPKTRKEVLSWFKHTPDAVLCSVGVLTTGFDEPSIETVILYRATKSLPLFLQMVGRGSRVTDSKKEFTILDFGNNIREHGFWEDDREWTLKAKEKKKQGAYPVKECPNCNALIHTSKSVCDYCGFEFPKKSKFKNAEVAKLEPLTNGVRIQRAVDYSVDEIVEAIKLKMINANAVLHKLKDQQKALDLIEKLGYKKGWLYINAKRFKVFDGLRL
jgi:superfamily II DNA or RNA helicase